MFNLYISIATQEGKAPVVVHHGYRQDDDQAILRASVDANGRINSPGYYGSRLLSYRTVVLRNEPIRHPSSMSMADAKPFDQRVLAAEGEQLSHEEWGGGIHRTIRAEAK